MGRRGRGEGQVRKRKDGRWEARITVGYDPETGVQKRYSRYFKTRKEAQDWLAQVLVEKNRGTFVEPHEITLGEWLDWWLEVYKESTCRRTTRDNYETMVRVHIKPALGHIPLLKLEARHLQEFYNNKAKEKSIRTVHLLHYIIGAALDQAVEEGKLPRNVNEATKLPPMRKKKEITPLSPEEVRKFLETAKNDRLYAAFLLEMATGLRRGELLALKWEDVDFEKGFVHVRRTVARVKARGGPKKTELIYQEPKTEKSREPVPVPAAVLEELKRHRAKQEEEKALFGTAYQDGGLVFCTPDGKQLDPSNFLRRYKSILRRAGLPPSSFHALRHTVATLLLEAGEELKNVQELLRHARLDITADLYAKVTERLKKKVSAKVEEVILRGIQNGEAPERS